MNSLDKKLNESSVTARLVELIMKMSEEEQQTLLKELEERFVNMKREHNRKSYFSAVDYSTQDVPYTDFIQNISAGGVFIGTNQPFTVGQEITLAFPLPVSQKHIRITGEIVRVSEQGIGVKFKLADDEQKAMIESLLDMMQ